MAKKGCVLFDWGDTLMRVFPLFPGKMKDWPRVEALSGAAEMLEILHPDWILALATNAADSDEADIRLALRRVNLDRWIDRIYCARKVGARKPSPEFFTFILEDLQLPAEQVIMVGDDYEVDMEGALRSGLRGIWLNERNEKGKSTRAGFTVHRLSEIPAMLKSLPHESKI